MTANTETEQLHQLLELVLTELDRKSIPFAYMQEIDRKGKAFIEQAARRAPAVPADALEKAKKYDHLFPYLCKTCGGFGLVDRRCQGDPLGAEPCPDCNSPAAPVPQGWKLVPEWPTVEMSIAGDDVYREDGPDVFSSNTVYTRMLAAAPQPPEADSNSPEFDGIKTEAAPVQMPEPSEYQSRMKPSWDEKHPWTDWEKCNPGSAADYERVPVLHDWKHEVRRLYTEQQVRDLLAAHGIGKDKA